MTSLQQNLILDYTYICTKWVLKRNGRYRCGDFKRHSNEGEQDTNWTITPLIDTNGNGLVLSSDGTNVTVNNDIGASNQRWLLSKEMSNTHQPKVLNLIQLQELFPKIIYL